MPPAMPWTEQELLQPTGAGQVTAEQLSGALYV